MQAVCIPQDTVKLKAIGESLAMPHLEAAIDDLFEVKFILILVAGTTALIGWFLFLGIQKYPKCLI